MNNTIGSEDTRPGGSPGSPSGARPRRTTRQRASGGRACHGARPDTARKSNVGNTSASPSRGPTTYRKQRWGRVRCQKGGSESRGSRRSRLRRQKLALGTWNVTSLGGKEPELVREVERYQLDLVGLTSTHSVGSGTLLLDKGWTLFFSGVAQSCEAPSGCGDTHKPPVECRFVGVYPSGREGRLPTPAGYGGGKL
ncbi:hypothetical protein PBY51_002652 [Eleginops maclovinus]|uniref:Uncharacterized protein n=1 Tax=Eleginops maclovinus TaxID=56733 RepID=A0AAN7XDC6_ELEMC|nr:hypothetical protein PBY51_002652 [Eleginops maclovinus]